MRSGWKFRTIQKNSATYWLKTAYFAALQPYMTGKRAKINVFAQTLL